jgi:hypothetical protein
MGLGAAIFFSASLAFSWGSFALAASAGFSAAGFIASAGAGSSFLAYSWAMAGPMNKAASINPSKILNNFFISFPPFLGLLIGDPTPL